MFLAVFSVICIALVPVMGGQISAIAEKRLRRVPAIATALAIQIIIADVIPGSNSYLLRALYVISYAFVAVFLVANRRVTGMTIIALGTLMNLLPICANLGIMPASPAALRTAGLASDTKSFATSTALSHPRLAFLGDVFAIPHRVPMANVFSLGDICIALGAAIVIHALCGSRLIPVARRIATEAP